MTAALLAAAVAMTSPSAAPAADAAIRAGARIHAIYHETRVTAEDLLAIGIVETRLIAQDRGFGTSPWQIVPWGRTPAWRRHRPTRQQLRDLDVAAITAARILHGCWPAGRSRHAAYACYNGGQIPGYAQHVERVRSELVKRAKGAGGT